MTALLLAAALADPLPAAVRNLSAAAFADRTAAEATLRAADPRQAYPLAFAASADPDPERAKRAAALLPDLDRRARTSLALTGPACELDLTDIPLADGLKAVGDQTGVQVGVDPTGLGRQRVTVKTPGRVPAWAAIQALAAAAGLAADDGLMAPAPPRLDAGPVIVPAPLAAPPGYCAGGWPARLPLPNPDDRSPLVAAFNEVTELSAKQPSLRQNPKEHIAWFRAKMQADMRLGDARRETAPKRKFNGLDHITLRPATAPVAACASGGFQVRTVPLPPELAASVPTGRGVVLLRLGGHALGGWWLNAHAAEARVAGMPPPAGRVSLSGVMVEPVGDTALVVGFDDRPRRVPAAGSPPFRTGVHDLLAQVPAVDRLPELRGTAAVELTVEVEERLDGRPGHARPSPVPVSLRVVDGRPVPGGYRLAVEVRYPLAVWVRQMGGRVSSRPWSPALDGPVQLAAADRFGFYLGLTGRPGATGELVNGSKLRFDTVLGVSADGELALDKLRIAVGADGVVTQTMTVTAAGKPARVRFNGVLAADVPFVLRDVPVLVGTGDVE